MSLPNTSEAISTINNITNESNYVDTTYYIDPDTNQLLKTCDGYQAVKQMIELMLNTPEGGVDVGLTNWGVDFTNLVGRSSDYIVSELLFRVSESLKVDERIIDVQLDSEKPFEILDGDSILIYFNIYTIYGEVNTKLGVQQ